MSSLGNQISQDLKKDLIPNIIQRDKIVLCYDKNYDRLRNTNEIILIDIFKSL